MSDPRSPAERLAFLERELADVLLRIHELERHGQNAWREHNERRALELEIDAVRTHVIGPMLPPPMPRPKRRPSALLRKVVEHTNRAADEIARRGIATPPVPVQPSEAITPIPDPMRLAAALIVGHIRANPATDRDAHEAYVLGILHDLTDPTDDV